MQYKAEVSLLKQLQCFLQKSSLEHEQSFGDVPAQSVESRRAPESSSEFVVWQVKLCEGVQAEIPVLQAQQDPPAPPEGLWHRLLQGKAGTQEPLPEETPGLPAAGRAGTPLPMRRKTILGSGAQKPNPSSLPGGIPQTPEPQGQHREQQALGS